MQEVPLIFHVGCTLPGPKIGPGSENRGKIAAKNAGAPWAVSSQLSGAIRERISRRVPGSRRG